MNGSILIVDDNPEDREAIRRMLVGIENIPGSILESEDETTCMQVLADNPDVVCILLDYSLPGRDGLQVLPRILELTPSVAVIVNTAYGNEEVAVEAMQLGAQDYLSKERLSAENLKRAILNATERASMEQKIREQQENLQTFAHLLVHDLRSPLLSVQDVVQVLSDELGKKLDANTAGMFEFVVKATRRMDQLIQTLRVYTELDADEPIYEAVDLGVQVLDVCDLMRAEIEAAGATVVAKTALPVIHGNPAQIAQLLQNLFGNSLKYNGSDAPLIEVSARETDDSLLVEISDNGIGIEKQYLEMIFQPFKRLHGTGEYEGTGLGLAMCRKIAARHDARLSCRSKPGEGTTFALAIPKQKWLPQRSKSA